MVRQADHENRIARFSKLNRVAATFHNANPKHAPMTPIDLDSDEVLGFLESLGANEVKYILVGGFAVAFHGLVRATYDLDLWIKDEEHNLTQFRKVLSDFGVKGLEEVRSLELIPGFTTFSLGDTGFEIDPLKSLKAFGAFDFDACYRRADEGHYKGISFKVLSRKDLLKEKETTNRPKDQEDIEHLRKQD